MTQFRGTSGVREEWMETVAAVVGPEVSSKGHWSQRERADLWVAGVCGLACVQVALGRISRVWHAAQELMKGHSEGALSNMVTTSHKRLIYIN